MQTKQKHWIRQAVLQLALVWALAVPLSAGAEMLDSVDIKRADGVAVIKITLSQNVRYRRHFPLDRGNIINIYFDNVAIESADRPQPTRPGLATPETLTRDVQREEHLRSPASDLVPYFWVAYLRNETGDPTFEPYYIAVQFSQTVNFSLRADEDNRAFYIYVPIAQHQNKTNGTTSPEPVKRGKGDIPVTPSPPAELAPATAPAAATTPAGEPATGSPP
jgi:hypothetical protein